ncbi:pantetheine-phosphate adenylyltransferase [Helicobacter sp. 11S02596-1]|uniref:pantetheine-phosphate adenylyltransferase n=1 Tax=Helicobacter sp. 11S02596-1 TaxID=1476194 RepID=UPI000BA6FCC0|nr:pantetheine-phosphate adenylyltransferase [Helicobacter sp. 11S02596-1]PAF42473.1 pantetheine-phosphate adenylyltransferase [Helicobacter sp. 11S02596-1]
MKKIAIYPGTFDPVTNGHLDIIKRSVELFDKVVIAIAKSSSKSPMFPLQDRKKMMELATSAILNAECVCFDNLLADFAKENNAKLIIRGLRVVSDFEYELQMGYANASLNEELDTIYFMPTLKNAFISSSIVRSILEHNGKVSHLIPDVVYKYILKIKAETKGDKCISH